MPYAQAVREDGLIPAAMTLLVKTRANTDGAAREIRTLAQDQDPNVRVGQVQPLEEVLAGIDLGGYDRRIVAWMGGWDTSTVLTVASWIVRARAERPAR